MAQSKTEKKLAELLKGKLCYKQDKVYYPYGIYQPFSNSILLDYSEHGVIMLETTPFSLDNISFYERTSQAYLDCFNRYVIDDDLDSFKKTGKLFIRSVDNDFYLELFKNKERNLSICIDRTGWLFLQNLNASQVNYIDKNSTGQVSKDQYENIYNKAKSYLQSKKYTLQCLKEHTGYNKDTITKYIRQKFALSLAEFTTTPYPTRSQYAQKEAFQAYYQKLRNTLSESQLQEENELLEDLYSKYVDKFLQEAKQKDKEKRAKDIETHKRTQFFDQNVQIQLAQLEDKILFQTHNLLNKTFSKIIFTCDYGYVEIVNNKLQFVTADSATLDFITQNKFQAFQDEFSPSHAIGQYFLNTNNNKYDFLLFDNGKYCIYLEGDKKDIKIDTHASFYRRRTAVSKKNGPAIDENLKALCKYDSFIETIEKSFDKNAILDDLIDTKVKLASDEVERSPDYQKSYQMQILEKLIDAFTENFLMDNFSEQEVSLFYQTYHQKLDEEIKHIHTLLKNEDQKEAKSQQKLESQLAEILIQKERQSIKQLPPDHENNL